MIRLIKSAQNGFSLQGIRIQVVFSEEPAEIALGEAVSDARGRFELCFRIRRRRGSASALSRNVAPRTESRQYQPQAPLLSRWLAFRRNGEPPTM